MKKTAIIALMFLFIGGAIQAQDKYGYVNFGNIVNMMPEMESANTSLKATQDRLVTEFQDKQSAFEAKYAQLQHDVSEGTVSRTKQEEREAALRQEQQELMNAQSIISEEIQQKRTELMSPIVEKVQNAIDAVGAEGGYKMIFDVSLGAMLYADEAHDLDAQVMAKLNITD